MNKFTDLPETPFPYNYLEIQFSNSSYERYYYNIKHLFPHNSHLELMISMAENKCSNYSNKVVLNYKIFQKLADDIEREIYFKDI